MISKKLNIAVGELTPFNASLKKDIVNPTSVSLPLIREAVLTISKNLRKSDDPDLISQPLKKDLSSPYETFLNLKRAIGEPLLVSFPLKAEYVPGESPYFVLEDGTIVQSEDGHTFKPEQ